MTTGYSQQRAVTHDDRIEDLVALLEIRGYRPQRLAPDGDRPDLAVYDPIVRRSAYVDLKTSASGSKHAIKTNALREFRHIENDEGVPVYVVWFREPDGMTVDTLDSLTARIEGGPRRPTGNGSNTDWYLVKPGGTPFTEFFVAP